MPCHIMITIKTKSKIGFNPFYPIFGKKQYHITIIDSQKSKHLRLMPINFAGCTLASLAILKIENQVFTALLTTMLISSTVLRIFLTKTVIINKSEIISIKDIHPIQSIDHILYFLFIFLGMIEVKKLQGHYESVGLIISIIAVIVGFMPLINIATVKFNGSFNESQ